jgi:hypothetical protein
LDRDFLDDIDPPGSPQDVLIGFIVTLVVALLVWLLG